ncbi:hypothetical protein PROAA_3710001 [Candidatus Propionivibrio aalborgensis]|uniref:Chaperone protein DnaK n=1 Tax=Candidatus Propionivibrio aalborgensis TaxID=1860101 RepID=A0A1A8XYP4_9RHOO|nr:hypothetical protein PROAA_3710001 [Candidatus Propionivibrio aalborgensis]
MYAKQQAESGATEGATAGGPDSGGTKKDDGDVVDAEFTEVNDKK